MPLNSPVLGSFLGLAAFVLIKVRTSNALVALVLVVVLTFSDSSWHLVTSNVTYLRDLSKFNTTEMGSSMCGRNVSADVFDYKHESTVSLFPGGDGHRDGSKLKISSNTSPHVSSS